jgi:hypothetical protein
MAVHLSPSHKLVHTHLFLLQGGPQGELVAPLVHTDAICAQHQAALLDACSSADACAQQPAVDADETTLRQAPGGKVGD